MPHQLMNNSNGKKYLSADCKKCLGLCCVALSFATSSDFAFDRGEGTPCRNLKADYRCGIHKPTKDSKNSLVATPAPKVGDF